MGGKVLTPETDGKCKNLHATKIGDWLVMRSPENRKAEVRFLINPTYVDRFRQGDKPVEQQPLMTRFGHPRHQ